MVGVFLDLSRLIEEGIEGDILFHMQCASIRLNITLNSRYMRICFARMILFNELRGDRGTTEMYEASVNFVRF